MGPVDKRERLQQFEALCRQRGLALTVQRRLILEAVLERGDHPTADQMYELVRGRIPGISRTTVYRVLETLVDVGVITKACTPGAATRFDPVTDRHHHLVCLGCEALFDLPDRELCHSVQLPDVRPLAFEIRDFSIHFHGICAACRRKLLRGRPAPRVRKPGRPSTAAARRGPKARPSTRQGRTRT